MAEADVAVNQVIRLKRERAVDGVVVASNNEA